MLDVLMPLLEELPARLDVFIRDDDAGWNDAQLLALLDVTERCGVPIDLAAIPGTMSAGLAGFLRARMAAAPRMVGVHQHGSMHLNHESAGRKCEFGVSRDAAAQRADIVRGWGQLREHFGDLLLPIFTPPWNRCTETTPALLAELGFAALSRDRGARPAQQQLQELAVDVDWSKHWRAHAGERGASAVAAAFAHALRERAADGQPLGLMLHHAVMQHDERAALQEMLGALAHHPRLHWRSMRELLVPMTPMNETTACTTFA